MNAAYTGQILPTTLAPYSYVLPYVTWKQAPVSGIHSAGNLAYLRTAINLLNIGPDAASVTLDYYLQDGTLQKSLVVPISSRTSAATSPRAPASTGTASPGWGSWGWSSTGSIPSSTTTPCTSRSSWPRPWPS